MSLSKYRLLILLSALCAACVGGCAGGDEEQLDAEPTAPERPDPMELIGGLSQTIVNGYNVEAQAAAQGYVRLWGWFPKDNAWKAYCSGSLITGNTLITAAHCQKGNDITPTFGVGTIIAQIGEHAEWVTQMTELTQNLDQTFMVTQGSFGNFSRTLRALNGNASAGARLKCVGRGAINPDGSIKRDGPQAYTVVTVESGRDWDQTWYRSLFASYNNSTQSVTHGDSGGGCFLIQAGPESSWPLVGVILAQNGSQMKASTFHP